MKRKISFILALATLFAAALSGCGEGASEAKTADVKSDSLYVEKVENLPEDFILGMDASCVPALEASGVASSTRAAIMVMIFLIIIGITGVLYNNSSTLPPVALQLSLLVKRDERNTV